MVAQLRPLNPVGFKDVGLCVGGPLPPCMGQSSRVACLERLKTDADALLYQNDSVFYPWPFSRYTTNAVYNTLDNTVYIPAGLLQRPFFDPAWTPMLQLASLGWIVAHEFSHALPISAETAACMDAVETVLTTPLVHEGSAGVWTAAVRANYTLNENYADHYALHYIMTLIRRENQNTAILREVFRVWAQTWCSGHPRFWHTGDPHAPAWLRVNATLEMSFPFTSAFACPQRYPVCLGDAGVHV